MRVGIIELIVDTPAKSRRDLLYATYFRKQFASIMPQAVAVWCRQLGHEVFYTTYYGQKDPRSLLPDQLDVVFMSVFSQASALAYALAKLYRQEGILTVIGGPHAKCFPTDSLRFFDIVVKDCDKALIEDILRGDFKPPVLVTSGRQLTDFPTVEERMPEIIASAFRRGRPLVSSIVPLLASIGCPYSCNFCTDWNNKYVPLPGERIKADLLYLSKNYPRLPILYHDPNFAVRFDETMDLIETIPPAKRNRYFMESSLSILKSRRLRRLRETNCVYVAPAIESWADYSNKTATGNKSGRDKLEHIIDHLKDVRKYVPGMDANFIFGTDADRGREPIELTKEFIRRLPFVFPTINIPTPFGGTPLFDQYMTEGRILREMPFAFYYVPYLTTTLKHYSTVEYYDHLIDVHSVTTAMSTLARRLTTGQLPAIRFLHALRTYAVRRELGEFRQIRNMLASEPAFRAFHEDRTRKLPDYYWGRLRERLGPYLQLLSPSDLTPVHK